MRRSLLISLPLALVLVLALAPAARGASLYSNLDAGSQGNAGNDLTQTSAVAQSFVPGVSGNARVASFYARAKLAGSTTSVAIGIYTNNPANGGQPGSLLAGGAASVGDTVGTAPTCTVLNAAPALTAGQTYWAVARTISSGTATWLSATSPAGPTKGTTNSGATWTDRAGAGASFRVDDNPACGPDINPRPTPGVEFGDMYARPNGTSFQTLFVANDGPRELTLNSYSFSGANSSMFRLYSGAPGSPEGDNFPFGKKVGAAPGTGVLLYVVCAPPTGVSGEMRATLTLHSDDPDEEALDWPVRCLVDNTAPSLEFIIEPDGRSGWYVTRPGPIRIRGVDPESGNRVARIFCADSGGSPLDWPSGFALFGIAAEGVHDLSCRGTDAAGNTSADGAHRATVRVDGTAPETTAGDGPPAQTDQTSATFAFTAADATSGVAEYECRLNGGTYAPCSSPATLSGLRDGPHTFQVRARDVAGNYDPTPAEWTWRIDTPRANAVDDSAAAAIDTPIDVDVLANDTDPRGRPLTVVLHRAATDQGGVVSLDGTKIRYAPPAGFAGTDSFTYRLANGSGVESAPATVTVRVAPPDRIAPVISKPKLSGRTLSFKLSEAGQTTLVVSELVNGRKKPVRRGTVTHTGRSGSNKVAIGASLLKTGRRYRLAITAVDAAGNASKATNLTVTVR